MSVKNNIYPRLTLVGIGPGSPDLITLRGIETIETADVILYDAYADDSLLKYAHEDAPKIFIGKRGDSPVYTQDQINALIVDHAFSYGHVVVLKAGGNQIVADTYQTLVYAEIFNIEAIVVPGVSNAILSERVFINQNILTLHNEQSDNFNEFKFFLN